MGSVLETADAGEVVTASELEFPSDLLDEFFASLEVLLLLLDDVPAGELFADGELDDVFLRCDCCKFLRCDLECFLNLDHLDLDTRRVETRLSLLEEEEGLVGALLLLS